MAKINKEKLLTAEFLEGKIEWIEKPREMQEKSLENKKEETLIYNGT